MRRATSSSASSSSISLYSSPNSALSRSSARRLERAECTPSSSRVPSEPRGASSSCCTPGRSASKSSTVKSWSSSSVLRWPLESVYSRARDVGVVRAAERDAARRGAAERPPDLAAIALAQDGRRVRQRPLLVERPAALARPVRDPLPLDALAEAVLDVAVGTRATDQRPGQRRHRPADRTADEGADHDADEDAGGHRDVRDPLRLATPPGLAARVREQALVLLRVVAHAGSMARAAAAVEPVPSTAGAPREDRDGAGPVR